MLLRSKVNALRHDLDAWVLWMATENPRDNLPRFLIAFDELRARLAPSKYPNLEITDEGCLWFNVKTSKGIVEIVGIPFGFEELNVASIIVSFPHEGKDVDLDFINRLLRIPVKAEGLTLFAGSCTRDKALNAYRRNMKPPLISTCEPQKIRDMKRKNVFFNYLGISLSIVDRKVLEVEKIIKTILLKMRILI